MGVSHLWWSMSTNRFFFFLKYWDNIWTFFCLAVCIDLRFKFEGGENILNFISSYMNQPSQLEGKEYEQLNTLYKYYETKYGSVCSSALTSYTFKNDPFFLCN